jgi:hypothetical protein
MIIVMTLFFKLSISLIFFSCFSTEIITLQWKKLQFHNKTNLSMYVEKINAGKTLLLETTHKSGDLLKENERLECSFLNFSWSNKDKFSIKFCLNGSPIMFNQTTYMLPSHEAPWNEKLFNQIKTFSCTIDHGPHLISFVNFEHLSNFSFIRRLIINAYLYNKEQFQDTFITQKIKIKKIQNFEEK